MSTRDGKKGRRKGTRNRGYFFRAGRGWCTSEGTRAVALTNADGTRITDPNTDHDQLKDALARYRLGATQPEPTDDGITVAAVCQLYLEHCKASQSGATYDSRAGTLFDFVTGLPAALRGQAVTPQTEKARIHTGFGTLTIGQLKPLHVDQWLAKHPNWNGCKRTRIQAIKRALNYGVEAGVISKSPIYGYKVAKSNVRKTYLTVEQEAACYKYAKADLAMAIRVCIRTGARFGCEFSKVTAKHVKKTDKGMEWRFSADESKTRKLRVIRISDPNIIAIVDAQIAKHARGPIFRNSRGDAWKRNSLSQRFNKLKHRLARHGIHLDDDACMYSCRHTYAKRTLAGHWTGKPTNIETLSQLMGNSREVCWGHYAEWCETYSDPIWASA